MQAKRRRGASGAQYALALGLVAVVALTALRSAGGQIDQVFCAVAAFMGGAGAVGCGDPATAQPIADPEAQNPTAPSIALVNPADAQQQLQVPSPGEAGPILFRVEDLETPAQALTVRATAVLNGPATQPRLTIDGTGNERSLTVALADGATDLSGTYVITLTVTDGPDAPRSASLQVTVELVARTVTRIGAAAQLMEPDQSPVPVDALAIDTRIGSGSQRQEPGQTPVVVAAGDVETRIGQPDAADPEPEI